MGASPAENPKEGPTMADSPNEAVVRRGYEAFNAADAATLSQLLADDVVQVNPGSNWSSGERKGRDKVLSMYAEYGARTNGNFAAELESVKAKGDDQVVARHRVKGERAGRTIDVGEEIVFTVENGQITRLDVTADDPAAEDAFWA
jgi:ketosteroid isomerase-like protein